MIRKIDDLLNTLMNWIKSITICSWKGHDYCRPYCFRCWKWFDNEFWEEYSK